MTSAHRYVCKALKFRERCQVWQKVLSLCAILTLYWSELKCLWNLANVSCIKQRTWHPAHVLSRYSRYIYDSENCQALTMILWRRNTFCDTAFYLGNHPSPVDSTKQGYIALLYIYILFLAWTSFRAESTARDLRRHEAQLVSTLC